ncbi:phage holin [Clostridium saccharoperbutylacetonicum]|uniref:phage holin n=1 Tax=Clostridium saccharoperbutylacetonicum TaxID=36745 RepID=UPI000983D253|nr:phage holin [Clostridium saccharoperbutylacetonicum]AQR98100.1 bacteriophage holin [Clostridium saccharoperbutylacetonicum]NSB33994.1 phi LC3 family holin [Clostridium saccharoperbutylacetonicum]
MNINLKSRLKNKAFWVYIVSTLVTLTQLFGVKVFPDNWQTILNTVLGLLVVMGVIVDNSTTGFSDNKTNDSEVLQ